MPVGHLRCAACERLREPRELVRLLERRIDQHQPAPLLRRHIGVERGPAVDRDRLGAPVAAQIARSAPRAAFGSSSQAIRRSCGRSSARSERRRAGIDGERAGRIERRDRRRDRARAARARLGVERRGEQPADAVAPFAGCGSPPGRRDRRGRRRHGCRSRERPPAFPQMHEDAREHRVLDDVGEIAGVEGVAIVHRAVRDLASSSPRCERPSPVERATAIALAQDERPASHAPAAHRRHHQLVAAAGAPVDLGAIAELQVLATCRCALRCRRRLSQVTAMPVAAQPGIGLRRTPPRPRRA